jgi:hypothetical protein
MAIAAFVVSAIGLVVAFAALWVSLRGTRAAERSAAAAEDSAQSSRQSALAATRSADVAEQGLDLDKRWADAEAQKEREAAAPRFEPLRSTAGGSSPGTFNLHGLQPRFGVHLRNIGGSTAVIDRASLHHGGGETLGAFQLDSEPGGGEQPPPMRVPPSESVTIVFEGPEIEALRSSTDRPRLEVSFTSPAGAALQAFVLGRMPADNTRRLQWRVLSEE